MYTWRATGKAAVDKHQCRNKNQGLDMRMVLRTSKEFREARLSTHQVHVPRVCS